MHPRLSPLTLGLAVASSSLCVLTLLAASAAGQTPSFTIIPPAPGLTSSYVTGLSADGRIATGNSGGGVGFIWSASTGRVDFATPAQPWAISGDGTTVAGSSGVKTFRWSGSGPIQPLGFLPGTNNSRATGVSGDGSVVVGYSQIGVSSVGAAFRWTQATGMQNLGYARPGDFYSKANGISRNGSTIVGFSADGGSYDAVVWTAGGITVLPQLPGVTERQTAADAVNVDGSIIVGRSGFALTPVIWNADGVTPLPRPWNMAPTGVSDTGGVVVGTATSNGLDFGFVWTPTRGTERLADYLIANGVTLPSGWTFDTCSAVSGDGFTVGGYGRLNGGPFLGFVATIPAPSSGIAIIAFVAITSNNRIRPSMGGTTS